MNSFETGIYVGMAAIATIFVMGLIYMLHISDRRLKDKRRIIAMRRRELARTANQSPRAGSATAGVPAESGLKPVPVQPLAQAQASSVATNQSGTPQPSPVSGHTSTTTDQIARFIVDKASPPVQGAASVSTPPPPSDPEPLTDVPTSAIPAGMGPVLGGINTSLVEAMPVAQVDNSGKNQDSPSTIGKGNSDDDLMNLFEEEEEVVNKESFMTDILDDVQMGDLIGLTTEVATISTSGNSSKGETATEGKDRAIETVETEELIAEPNNDGGQNENNNK